MNIEFYEQNDVDNNLFKFSVIVAKYNDEWIFCKHKNRDTFEIAGGHIEPNESALQCAKRELFEETGATDFDISPVYAYSVDDGISKTYGMLFFADVFELGCIPPEFEMEKIIISHKLPDNLTYPEMQSKLFERVQWWRNSFGVEDEIWDIYDDNRNLTGKTHKRGELMKAGDHHIVVHIVIKNSDNLYLVTKRAPNKAFPNIWEFTGGSAISGDNSLSAAMREVFEETGFQLLPQNGKIIMTQTFPDCFSDMWLFQQDFDINNIVLQENETTDAMLVSKNEILKLIKDGKFSTYSFLSELIELI